MKHMEGHDSSGYHYLLDIIPVKYHSQDCIWTYISPKSNLLNTMKNIIKNIKQVQVLSKSMFSI